MAVSAPAPTLVGVPRGSTSGPSRRRRRCSPRRQRRRGRPWRRRGLDVRSYPAFLDQSGSALRKSLWSPWSVRATKDTSPGRSRTGSLRFLLRHGVFLLSYASCVWQMEYMPALVLRTRDVPPWGQNSASFAVHHAGPSMMRVRFSPRRLSGTSYSSTMRFLQVRRIFQNHQIQTSPDPRSSGR